MNDALDKWAADLVKSAAPAPNQSTKVVANIPIWYEVALFPVNSDISEVHRLADVQQLHGKLITQEFPDCTICRPSFTLARLPKA